MRANQRDQKGPQAKQVAHEQVVRGQPVTKIHVPAANIISAQKKLPINPIKKPISDDSVDVVDEGHLQQVEESAEACGL
jgi:hypothetical protein